MRSYLMFTNIQQITRKLRVETHYSLYNYLKMATVLKYCNNSGRNIMLFLIYFMKKVITSPRRTGRKSLITSPDVIRVLSIIDVDVAD